MSVEARLRDLGIRLPAPQVAYAGNRVSFTPVRVEGSTAYVSGHGPADGASILMTGRVGGTVNLAEGVRAAELCALSMLASLRAALGSLDRVTGWLRVLGFVRCVAEFTEQPVVLNGFSDIVLAVWGEAGGHARSAVGVAELPFGIPVEVEAAVMIEESG